LRENLDDISFGVSAYSSLSGEVLSNSCIKVYFEEPLRRFRPDFLDWLNL
jgi:hypothetical protein